MILLYLWYLFALPQDRLICTLWVSQPPARAALIEACGTDALEGFELQVMDGPTQICTLHASQVLWVVEDCGLNKPLHNYTLRIVEPDRVELVCSVTVDHEGQPSAEDVAAQCPDAPPAYTAELQKVWQPEPPAGPKCEAPQIPPGAGLYDQPASAAELVTDQPLAWLAGRLIWHGLVKPQCDGLSGLDPYTLAANPCGEASARSEVITWQNRYNAEIYSAAVTYHVPARLLKRMMSIESQWWPYWAGEAGETGIMQVTENGADVLLRYDPDLDHDYIQEDALSQLYTRRALLDRLGCSICQLDAALEHTRQSIPIYARLLAAYRCRAVEISQLTGADAWRQAAMDYNGSAEYIRRIE